MLHVFVLGDTQPVEVRQSGKKKSGKLLSQRASENACAKNRNLLTLLDMTYVVKTSSNAEKGHASPRDFICQCLTGVWPLHPPKPWVEEQD